MVQFMGLRDHASESKVNFIIEDSLEEEHAPLNKRCKQWSSSDGSWFGFPSQGHSILDEPSPLGLRLKKSLSLLDLIQEKLSQEEKVLSNTKDDDNLSSGVKKESRGRGPVEKLKASNFPATVLRIGSWEYKSKHEGDLVAKCYFAKQKLVWEVLEGELKSKIEIQWADITALKANCPDIGPSTLSIVVARQPLFFRETNPQPRKHTLWQTASDFTGGQAIKSRKHFLQCEQGLLIKHFEKLIQCDERLQYLSQQPEITLDSPHFDFSFDKHDNLKKHDSDGKGSATSRFQNMGSPHSSLSPSFTLDSNPFEAASSCSEGIISSEADSKGPNNWDQIKLPGLCPSMSMSDFIGHIGHIEDELASGNLSSSAERMDCSVILKGLVHHLFNDNHVTTDSDEKSVMLRVNSLCCLLQNDPVGVPNSHDNSQDNKSSVEGPNDMKAAEEDSRNVYSGQQALGMSRKDSFEELLQNSPGHQAPGMSRKDSFGEFFPSLSGHQAPGMSRKDSCDELLHNLPRITSLPKFLSNISEDLSHV